MNNSPPSRIPQEGSILDLNQARKLLDALFEPGDLIEIRPIESWTSDDGHRRSRAAPSIWVTANNIDSVLPQLADLNEQGFSIYFGISPRASKVRGKAGVKLVRTLWADLDDCRPSEAIKRIRDARLPAANAVIDSGHGTHAYWVLGEAVEIHADADRRKVEAVVREIGNLIGGDHVRNIDRLLRLPGFRNVKNLRNGQKPTPCVIHRVDDDSVWENLEHATSWLPEAAQFRVDAIDDVKLAPEPTNGKPIPHDRQAWARRKLAERTDDRSGRDHSVCCRLFEAGCSRAAVAELVAGTSKFQGKPDYLCRTLDAAQETAARGFHGGAGATDHDGLDVVTLADVQPEPVVWLWPHRVALGKLTIIAGDPGLGKSFLTLDMAARVSTGTAWPNTQGATNPPGGVVLLSAEDDLADTIRPRLDAAGADCTRIKAIRAAARRGPDGRSRPGMFSIADDLPRLEKVIESVEGCRLVVVDPVSAYMGRGLDSHKNTDVRGVLAPLAELAARCRVAVVAVSHLRKGEGKAIYRTMGSLAFVAAARAAWAVVADRDDSERRLFLSIKNNLARGQSGLAFRLREKGLGGEPVLAWDDAPVMMSVDEAMSERRDGAGAEGPDAATDEAEEWLRSVLAHGPVVATEIQTDARRDSISRRALGKAKLRLGVVTGPGRARGPWVWQIPKNPPERPESNIDHPIPAPHPKNPPERPESNIDQSLPPLGEVVNIGFQPVRGGAASARDIPPPSTFPGVSGDGWATEA